MDNSLKPAALFFTEARQRWLLVLLTAFTFFFLLGSRALNEPDEGRYAEIAREMIETGNWLVPHFWYLPHLDKPPMTYWLVAASMKLFGQNEWAVRLPVALAGIGGVWATFLLGCSLGGRRVGFWSALISQSSLLYFVMARFLTTDIFLTQFTVWAIYFFWRSWLELNLEFGIRNSEFFKWHLAGWAAIALGFLTKGPIAFAIPMVSFLALMIYRRKKIFEKKVLFGGLAIGILIFFALAAPWFLAVFRRVPQSAHFMILGQAAGHLLGTTIKNRTGSPFYFFAILLVGLLPWTILLGWLWRFESSKSKVQNPQSAISKNGWLILNVWAIFTFVLFSFSHSKLPAYILPIFPALAVMLAWKFFRGEENSSREGDRRGVCPTFAWQICLASALLLPAIFPLLAKFVFHNALPDWMKWQTPVIAGIAILILWLARKWKAQICAAFAIGLTLFGFFVTVAEIPLFETNLKANQTLKPLGAELAKNFQPGDAIVCWGKIPEGLPFYSGAAISATNRPYFGGMNLTQVPFEFPGNRERLGHLLLPDENALAQLVQSKKRVWIVGFDGMIEKFQKKYGASPLHLVTRSGQWELFLNRR
ncbi:MAG: ArnT family glycosyltransferase [Limisphaerales bacterium]